jgi:hypothetical protein
MEAKLNVKDKSVQTFLEERLISYKADNRCGTGSLRDGSPYYLMRDEMFFKKDCGIEIGEIVKIELFDRSQGSDKELKNIYTYKAEEYDDVAIKMVLIDFAIEPKIDRV